MRYAEAYAKLGDMGAKLSSSFGYPRDPGYTAYYRTPDGTRYELSNGPWHSDGLTWTIRKA